MHIVLVLFLLGAATACTCLNRDFCHLTMDAVNLLKAVVTSSKVTETGTVYYLHVSKVVKGKPVTYLTTASSSATCGLALEVGTEYLIATDAAGRANMCGPSRPWASLTPDEHNVLKRGGLCASCSTVKCSKFQDCKIDDDGAAYCADNCAEGRCRPDETCSLTPVQCIRAPCPDIAKCAPCKTTCTLQYNPVCGSDRKTYGNACALANAVCANPKLTKAHDGECKRTCNRPCPHLIAPVCGSDGKTYSNACLLAIAICRDPNLTKAHDGACNPDCDRICPEIFDPVCGSDGKTYPNACFLSVITCRDPTVTQAHDDSC